MVYSAWFEKWFPPLMTENKKAMLFYCVSHFISPLQERSILGIIFSYVTFQSVVMDAHCILIAYSFTQSLQVTGPHLQTIPWSLTGDFSTELSEMDG